MSRPAEPTDPHLQLTTMSTGPFSYTDDGDGPVVVTVSGYPGGPRDFRWLATALGSDVRMVRLAMPCFGQTPLATEPATDLLGRARFVARAVEALELSDVTLVGHSMGGGLAGMAAVELGSRVRALGLLCSIGPIAHPTVRGRRIRVFERLLRVPVLGWPLRRSLPTVFGRIGFPPVWSEAQLLHTMACAADLDFTQWADRMDQLRCPTLVAWGEDDPLVPADISRSLAARVPAGPRLAFADGGHSIQKHHAVEIAAELRGMMGLSPRPPGPPAGR